jgi:hypothetical protein
MDIRREMLKEHSRAQANKVVKYVANDPEKIKTLVSVFLEGPSKVTQRTAWPLSICAEQYPGLFIPHLKSIIGFLKKEDVHDAVKRNILRTLQFMDIPKRHHPILIDLCFQYLQNKKEAIAIRVFAMAVLSKITKDHPDLGNELKIIIEENLPYSSAAFISRAKKVLKQIATN